MMIYNNMILSLFVGALLIITPPVLAQEIHLEDELILFLPMNGNALDESGQNVATLIEGPVLTVDRHENPNSAFLFDGIDDQINLNNNKALITSKQFTICMWARVDGRSHAEMSASNSLFEQRNDDAIIVDPVVIHFNSEWSGNTRLVLRSNYGIQELHTALTEYPGDGTWHHYTAMVDETKIMYIFIDGKLRTTGTFTNDGNFTTGVNRVNIGAHHPHSIITGAFNGAIDEVYIYNRALNLCEIEALFSGQLLDER